MGNASYLLPSEWFLWILNARGICFLFCFDWHTSASKLPRSMLVVKSREKPTESAYNLKLQWDRVSMSRSIHWNNSPSVAVIISLSLVVCFWWLHGSQKPQGIVMSIQEMESSLRVTLWGEKKIVYFHFSSSVLWTLWCFMEGCFSPLRQH